VEKTWKPVTARKTGESRQLDDQASEARAARNESAGLTQR
jgi:hypothetical protein